MKIIKNITIIVLLVVLSFAYSNSANATFNNKYASIVVDAATGRILSQRYADKRLHPASLTKIMTLYLAFDALKAGKLKKWQKLRVSKHAASMVPSKLGLKAGSKIRVDDAIAALVTKSANDIAVVLAEAIGGSEKNFARMMTRKARILGMRNTFFVNASGLHDRRQISTARDMAVLARSLLLYHPEYYHYFSMRSFRYAGKTYKNHNKLLGTYKGMDGIKTGYVRASGFNLAASAIRDGHRLIGVVFGGKTGQSRNRHMASLLDRGFAKAKRYRLAKWHRLPPIPSKKPITPRIEVASSHTNIQDKLSPISKLPAPKPNTKLAMMGLLVGEGDIDLEASESLVAMSKTNAGLRKNTSTLNINKNTNNWQIQIGAFASEKAANQALEKTNLSLKQKKVTGIKLYPKILPLKTTSGTIYRARLAGLSKEHAFKTCAELNNCIIVASRNVTK